MKKNVMLENVKNFVKEEEGMGTVEIKCILFFAKCIFIIMPSKPYG